MEAQDNYRIEEVRAAHHRIDQEISTMNQFEILSATAIGAIYWLFFAYSIIDPGTLKIVTALPVLICLYGIFRYRAHAGIVQTHEGYIKEIELKFFGESGGLITNYDKEKPGLLKWARLCFWFAIFLISFSIFVIAVACPDILINAHNPKSQIVSMGYS